MAFQYLDSWRVHSSLSQWKSAFQNKLQKKKKSKQLEFQSCKDKSNKKQKGIHDAITVWKGP